MHYAFRSKGKSLITPLLNSPEVLSSASDKNFAKNFSKNSNIDDLEISSPVFPFRTTLKLNNISVTPKMVKKVVQTLIHQTQSCLVLIVFQW